MPDQPTKDNDKSQPSEAQLGEGEARDDEEKQAQGASESKPRGSLSGAGLRYAEGDDVPSWAVGKTADEIVRITEDLRKSVLRSGGAGGAGPDAAAPQASPQSQSTPPQPPPTRNEMNAPKLNPNDLYSNPEGFTQNLEQYVQAATQGAIANAAQGITAPIAQMARSESMRGEYKDVWDRYGPEIDNLMTNVPASNRANAEMWNQAAEMIAGRHWKELAQAEAEKTNALADSGMMPSDGRTSSGVPQARDAIEQLFLDDHPSVKAFKQQGMSAADVRAHAKKMNHDPETYANMLRNKRSLRYHTSGSEAVHV